ncbi:carboxylesterase family protein [Amycolatopsis sp. FU40]|uniref:carboxylesterase family protein n=1 Tax=Amycolatopsis sp. FU40 TaxID=2914159 RepID=UPI001F3AF55C|nr:carboxylesterase family protein [Amycolatopsis sp. FU40]UKD52162.1 carboxylesterase family protein [Amycolatopsis sp. FU40]
MTESQPVTARPPSGPVLGASSDDGLLRFRGVRYGTAERFQLPRPAEPRSDAVLPGPICPQLGSRLEAAMGPPRDEPPQSEDCLNLAVVTPALTGARPVLVWLHGGGFLSGGGTLPWYDGGRLAADGDVVVVSVNYRLGALGYLVHDGVSEGNLGLADQALALEWVRDNIAAFGGDPGNVTVFGQSAGALSTLALLSEPDSRSLIRRAIVQSSPDPAIIQDRRKAREIGRYFVDAVGGDPVTASVDQLLAAQQRTLRWNAAKDPTSTRPPFGIVDLEVQLSDPLPDLMIGYTTQECEAFAIGVHDDGIRQAIAVQTEPLFARPARDLAQQYGAYSYEFDWTPDHGGYGAIHCLELPFLLGTPESWRGSPMLGDTSWADVERLGTQMRLWWTEFARSGKPGPQSGFRIGNSPQRLENTP